jgi:hypothetical protein
MGIFEGDTKTRCRVVDSSPAGAPVDLEYEAMPLTIDPAPTEDRVLEVGAPKGRSGHDELVSDESLPR